MSQRFEGRNLEEALQEASSSLGVQRFELTYHVVQEKRGFLGGVKHVIIEADVNQEAVAAPVAKAKPAPPVAARPEAAAGDAADRNERAAAPVAPESARGPRPARGRRERSRDRGRGGRERGGRGRGGNDAQRQPRRVDELRVGDFEHFATEIPEQGPESDTAKAARAWCERLIALSKLDLVIRTEENDTQVILRLFGSDSVRLTERHGELLDAMQVLANKSLTGRKIEKDIELDCEKFKERRTEDLEERAREAADRVRRDGREQLLPAMSPIERRIVHLTLQDDPEVATDSRGDGFFKRVAIIPRHDAPLREDEHDDEQSQEP